MIVAQKVNPVSDEVAELGERCRTLLRSSNSISYSTLLKALRGTSPDAVVAALQQLDVTPQIIAILRQASTPLSRPQIQGRLLPLPHPCDAEWRFDSRTVDLLLDEVLGSTADGDNILFFGTPGAAIGARDRKNERRFSVISPANVIESSLRSATEGDARFQFERVSSRSCHSVLMDPPWYLPAYEGMLAAAAPLCKKGAHLYLSVPGVGTRPSAASDNEQVIKFAENAGFELIERRLGVLRYISPLFEISAFDALGIFAPPGWRRSDLYIFRLKSRSGLRIIPAANSRSFELTVGGCRIRLALNGQIARSCSDEFYPLISGDVYPSVSRRDPLRLQANLWTSTNRAYGLDPAKGLLALGILAKSSGVMLPERLDQQIASSQLKRAVDKIQPLIQKLEDLVATEIRDSQRLAQGANVWLKSANDARFLKD